MALFPLLFSIARSFFAHRLDLMAEILALRQQLAILNRTAKRPSFRVQDRLFWATLAKCWQDWRYALLIIKPELSLNGIAKGFVFIGAGSRKQVARDDQESMLIFANLSAGSHKRIPCGARHEFNPNLASLGLRWLNQPSRNT
jgi:hypothetical protein